jgi:hypothetical protein
MSNTITEYQLQAAFLAARGHGKILDDEVLRDIITAAREALPPWQPANNGSGRYRWFLYRGDEVPHESRWFRNAKGNVRRFATYEAAKHTADTLNAAAKRGDTR